MAKQSKNEAIFISEYIKDRNATRSYQIAYPRSTPGTARVLGCKLVEKYRDEIDAKIKELIAKNEITAEKVLQEDGRIAFSDITVMFPEFTFPEELRPAIKSIKMIERTQFSKDGEYGETTRTLEMSLWDKGRSLERLGKHLGIYTDKIIIDDLSGMEEKIVAANKRAEEARRLAEEAGDYGASD